MLAMDRGAEPESSRVADTHDPAEDLFGPRSWSRILATESARCRRHGRTATVVIVEVPGPADDATPKGSKARGRALARVGRALRTSARTSDYVARIEPGYLAVLLPETDEVAAVNFVERARPACDGALASPEPGDRCRFGWADGGPSRTLDEAVDVAIVRLAADR